MDQEPALLGPRRCRSIMNASGYMDIQVASAIATERFHFRTKPLNRRFGECWSICSMAMS